MTFDGADILIGTGLVGLAVGLYKLNERVSKLEGRKEAEKDRQALPEGTTKGSHDRLRDGQE